MNESIIKEVKSIYSAKIRTNTPLTVKSDIKTIKPDIKNQKTFFNGVIEKLNIITKS